MCLRLLQMTYLGCSRNPQVIQQVRKGVMSGGHVKRAPVKLVLRLRLAASMCLQEDIAVMLKG